MKVKLNLNVGGLKQLAIHHGEKAAFGLGVLLLVMFIWSASKTEVLGPDKQPQPLSEAATKTEQAVLNSKWDAKAKGVEVVDYVRRAKRDPLNDKDYRLSVFLNKPLWELKGKRPDPKILPVEEMLASAGLGILAMTPPDAPAQPGGKPPKPGARAGARARDPAMATRGAMGMPDGMPQPGRAGAAARPGDAGLRGMRMPGPMMPGAMRSAAKGNLKGFSWVVVTGLVPIRKQEAEFEEAFRNVIDPEPDKDIPEYRGYKVERAEVHGDAPLEWQEIKLRGVEEFKKQWSARPQEVVDAAYVDPMYTQELGPLVDRDWDPAVVGHPKVPIADNLTAASAPVEADQSEDEDDAEGFGVPKNQGRRNLGPGPGALDPRMARGPAGAVRRQTEFTLFRFVDYTVEPAKQYRYRVKLRLSNPNWNVAEKYLKDVASRAKKFVESSWSEMTPVVTVPRDVDLFAGSVVRASKEPQINIMVTKLDRAHGLKIVGEDKFQRGSLANLKKKVSFSSVPDEPETEARLESHAVVVDILGGGRLSPKNKSLTVPGEVLVLDADGRLVLHDELDDEADTEANRPETADAKASEPNPMFPGANPYDDMPKSKGKAAGGKKGSRLEKLKSEAAAKKKKT